jgi:hypothetical protein
VVHNMCCHLKIQLEDNDVESIPQEWENQNDEDNNYNIPMDIEEHRERIVGLF